VRVLFADKVYKSLLSIMQKLSPTPDLIKMPQVMCKTGEQTPLIAHNYY